jgi:3-isopropylmalate dehydrogenase
VEFSIAVLSGDGIGPEVTREAILVLEHSAQKWGHSLHLREGLLGGAAIRATGGPFPEETKELALASDATLLGAVGLPEYDNLPPSERPEKGLLGLRKALDVYANLRPIYCYESLIESSPLKNEIVRGTDILIVRELTGGLYFGQPRGIEGSGGDETAVNSMVYTRSEIERVCRMAFELARKRRGKLTSVDKANVLENSQLWRRVVTAMAADYADVELEHMLVDNCAMQLLLRPTDFDVMVTENLFGDILSDEGSVLAGSIGMLPSASVGNQLPNGAWRGLFEPVHGSAPDIAGQGKANPLAAIGSAAAMLNYSFGLTEEANAIESAISQVLESGRVTADLKRSGAPASTEEVGSAVCEAIG